MIISRVEQAAVAKTVADAVANAGQKWQTTDYGRQQLAQAYALCQKDQQAVRNTYWQEVPLLTRKLVCRSVGIDVQFAHKQIRDMRPDERQAVHHEAIRLIKQLEQIIRATQGRFYVPAPAGMAPHEPHHTQVAKLA